MIFTEAKQAASFTGSNKIESHSSGSHSESLVIPGKKTKYKCAFLINLFLYLVVLGFFFA